MESLAGELRFVSVDSGLPVEGWTRLLEKWAELMTRFIRVSESCSSGSDLPYWYNEYSNINNLAAAAWILDGVGLQEYTVDKCEQADKTTKGRCDLWLCVPSLKIEYTIEAKFNWPSTYEATIKDCSGLIQRASKQVRNYGKGVKNCEKMAACFLSPYNASERDAREILDKLRKWFCEERRTPPGLLAIYEPPAGTKTDFEGDYYPGVALFAQMV